MRKICVCNVHGNREMKWNERNIVNRLKNRIEKRDENTGIYTGTEKM